MGIGADFGNLEYSQRLKNGLHSPEVSELQTIEVFHLVYGKVSEFYISKQDPNGVLEFNTVKYPAGVYGYRLVVDGKPSETKKLVILK